MGSREGHNAFYDIALDTLKLHFCHIYLSRQPQRSFSLSRFHFLMGHCKWLIYNCWLLYICGYIHFLILLYYFASHLIKAFTLNFPGDFSRGFREKLDIFPKRQIRVQNKRMDGVSSRRIPKWICVQKTAGSGTQGTTTTTSENVYLGLYECSWFSPRLNSHNSRYTLFQKESTTFLGLLNLYQVFLPQKAVLAEQLHCLLGKDVL